MVARCHSETPEFYTQGGEKRVNELHDHGHADIPSANREEFREISCRGFPN
jgi:hypothetical protein